MILVGFATSKGDDGGSPPSRGRACISVACRFRCRKSFPYRGCSHASSEPVVPSASALGPTKRLVFFFGPFLTPARSAQCPEPSSARRNGAPFSCGGRLGNCRIDSDGARPMRLLDVSRVAARRGRPIRRSADRNRENRRCSAVSERRRCTTYRGCQRSICRAVSASSRRRSVRSSGSSANHAAP